MLGLELFYLPLRVQAHFFFISKYEVAAKQCRAKTKTKTHGRPVCLSYM